MRPEDSRHLECEIGGCKSRWRGTKELLKFLYKVHLIKIVIVIRQRRPFLVRSGYPAL